MRFSVTVTSSSRGLGGVNNRGSRPGRGCQRNQTYTLESDMRARAQLLFDTPVTLLLLLYVLISLENSFTKGGGFIVPRRESRPLKKLIFISQTAPR